MKRNSAYDFLQQNGIDVGKDNFSYAAKNDNGIFWVNPHKSVLKQNWWLILDDKNPKEPKLYVFFIPANSFGEDQFYIRKDLKHVDQIQLQFEHKNGMFVDTTSKVDISRWLSKTLKYGSVSKSVGMMCQKIFFGAPGTGKSHKVNLITPKDNTITFRTTFHPDYDYAQFVGSYKPKKEGSSITYSFVPQVFAKAYAAAWKNLNQPVYLVIEEINRGNCAQIFGDLFQLLDRDEIGYSSYAIDADADFAEWIEKQLDSSAAPQNDIPEEIRSGRKLRLPPNFNILATMNTSDQSLFPMDSAFKRRFDWEYVPIDYKKTESDFTIVIGDKKYRWLDFLKKVNADIYTATESEDKQMGEFFVKPSDGKTIDLPTFCSKVLFYLWDSVYKDDDQNKKIFRFDWKFDDEEKNRPVTFQSLFEDEKTKIAIVQKMMENLNVPEKQ